MIFESSVSKGIFKVVANNYFEKLVECVKHTSNSKYYERLVGCNGRILGSNLNSFKQLKISDFTTSMV